MCTSKESCDMSRSESRIKVLLPISIDTQGILPHVLNQSVFYSTSSECINHACHYDSQTKILIVIKDKVDAEMLLPVLQNSKHVLVFSTVADGSAEWAKCIQRFPDVRSLLNHLEVIADEKHHQPLTLHFLSEAQRSILDLSAETPQFMWTQLLLAAIQKMPPRPQAFDTMVDACVDFYLYDAIELRNIKEFRQTYRPTEAIRWYTRSCFIYRLVNRALRTRDIDGLLIFAPFICDLHNQIAEEQNRQRCTEPGQLLVYRGQQLPECELEQFRASRGQLVSTNAFFSTSHCRSMAELFAGRIRANDHVPVLFIISVDKRLQSTICADITHLSAIQDEDEVLFSLSAVFHVHGMKYNEKKNYWEIYLKATDEGRETLEEYKECLTKSTDYNNPNVLFGQVLFEMSLYEKAHQYYTALKNTLSSKNEVDYALYNIYHGRALFLCGRYAEALEILVESQTIFERLDYDSKSIQYLQCRFNIANAYVYLSRYKEALEIYSETLQAQRQLLPRNHRHIADSLSGISWVLSCTGDTEQALRYSMESLEIRRCCLPPYHPTIMHTLRAIGQYHESEGRWDKANEYFSEAHAITMKYLPPTHDRYAFSLLHFGLVCEDQVEYDQALSYYLQALSIYRQKYKAGHPSLAHTLDCIGNIYRRKQDYMNAHDSYQQALKIRKNVLPVDHLSFSATYFGIGNVFLDTKEHDRAIEFLTTAFEIQKKYLALNNPTVCRTLSCLATAHSHKNELVLAKSMFQDVLTTQQAAHPRGHPDIGVTMHHMASNYQRMGLIDEAVELYKKSIAINQRFFPSSHIEITSVQRKLEELLRSSDRVSTNGDGLRFLSFVDTSHVDISFCHVAFVLLVIFLLPCPPAFSTVQR